jgi:CRP-like cAMP-binding protein
MFPMILPEEMNEIEFLRSLGEQHVNRIARLARHKECEKGTVVFRQGQGSPFIYFVLNGEIGLQVEEPGGESVEVSTVGPGGLLGWSPLLGRQAMTATARATTPCQLAVLDVPQLLELCEQDPHFGIAFLRQIALVMSDRLWDMRRNFARALSHRQALAAVPEGSD